MSPRSADPGATAAATAAPGRRGASTIGRSRPLSSASSAEPRRARRRAVARSAAMTAKGFSSRRLRARSRATASSSSARQARWKPPRPFTAAIAPSSMAAAAAATGSVANWPMRRRPIGHSPARRTEGPQSGHALGSAWKRRSAGSSYSARQRSHIANPAIVVVARS